MMGIELLPEIWPDWEVVEQIGEGAFGKVYKAVRNDTNLTTYAAIKVITVPKSESEVESLQAEGMSIVGAKSYLQGIVSDFINEIRLMESMKGNSNIVSVEDYKVIEKKEGIGWDIFIRMELLSPLVKKLAQSYFDEKDVIKLGIDICSALELCAKSNIVHRDIKPENIFVSNFGDYKIGDFGIAKQLEKTSSALSSKGTFNYIAPEVARGQKYDARVDIYSLGIVLYKLLNNNRLPFIDPYSEQISYEDKRHALERRLSGEVLPPPVKASEAMATVIGMACRFNPDERFSTPTAMKNALTRVLNQPASVPQKPATTYRPPAGTPQNSGIVNTPVVPPQHPVPMDMTQSNRSFNPMITVNDSSKNSGSGRGMIIAIILVVVIAVAIIAVAYSALAGYEGDNARITESSTTVSVCNEAETVADITSAENTVDVVVPDFYYTEPLYRYVDVDDQYDGDPLRMRTGPGKDGTEKITEIPDGNYVYVHGGLSDRNDWVYVEFQGNYGWVLSKYLHNV